MKERDGRSQVREGGRDHRNGKHRRRASDGERAEGERAGENGKKTGSAQHRVTTPAHRYGHHHGLLDDDHVKTLRISNTLGNEDAMQSMMEGVDIQGVPTAHDPQLVQHVRLMCVVMTSSAHAAPATSPIFCSVEAAGPQQKGRPARRVAMFELHAAKGTHVLHAA